MGVFVERATSGGAGQCVMTVCSVEEGLGTFAVAGAAGEGSDRMGVPSGSGVDPVVHKENSHDR